MANITKYLEKAFLNHSVGLTLFSKPTNTYAALFTTSPTVNYTIGTTDGLEIGTSPRPQISWNAAVASTDLTNSSSIKNSNSIAWSSISSNGNPITTIGVFDSPTIGSGSLLWFGPLSTSVTLTTSDTFTIPANSLTLTLG